MENKFPAPGEIFHKSQSSDLAKYGDIGTKMRPPVEGCNTYIQTFFYMKLQPGDFFYYIYLILHLKLSSIQVMLIFF